MAMQKRAEVFPAESEFDIKIDLCHLWHPTIDQMIGKFAEVPHECLANLSLNSGTEGLQISSGDHRSRHGHEGV